MLMSNWISVALILVASWGVCVIGEKKIPDYIHPCHRSDPEAILVQCILDNLKRLKPLLKEGSEELNIPAMDPFKKDKVLLLNGKDGHAFLTDVDARGAEKFEVDQLELNIPKKRYKFIVKIQALEVTAKYNFDLNLLGLPIKSAGKYYSKSTGIHGHVILQAGLGKNNRLIFKSISLKLKVDDFDLKLESSSNENRVIAQGIQELYEANKPEFTELMTPWTEKAIADMLLPICNNIFKDFDYDEIFPI